MIRARLTLDELAAAYARSSLLYWWPVVEASGVPAPRTIVIRIGEAEMWDILTPRHLGAVDWLVPAIDEAARRLGGYPAFLRTDHVSGKHDYAHTCYLPGAEAIGRHLYRLLEDHLIADLPIGAIVVRELLPVEARLRAWDDLPIAAERRYFVRDGRVVCHHPYWPREALPRGRVWVCRDGVWRWAPRREWQAILDELNQETPEEVAELAQYAEAVGKRLPGYWSIDFLRSTRGWHLIDMAAGEVSWHPDDCPTHLTDAPE